jgi:hypothetical protein
LLGDEAAELSPTLLEESLLEAAARRRFSAAFRARARARRALSGSCAGGDMLRNPKRPEASCAAARPALRPLW